MLQQSIRNYFGPAPIVKEISDQNVISKLYGYWRIRIFYSMFIGYALYYFTRKSFTFAMPGLIIDLGFDKSHLGILSSIFSITYGISKFASGILSDRSNSRYFMAVGLMVTGILNILFGLSSTLLIFAIFWALNGWFQGFGWPPCSRFLMNWYSQSERGKWWGVWNISHNMGAFIIPWIVGACLYYSGWRSGMYIPGIVCIMGSLVLINRLRDTPQSLGLPTIEKFRNDFPDGKMHTEKTLTTREILRNVIQNKALWVLGAAYFFVYILRTGISDWSALYLLEIKGYSLLSASGCVSLFEIGGIFGSLCAGWISDNVFNANRGPVNILFSVGALFGILGFWFVPPGNILLDSFAIFFIGFAIFGPQMLIGMVAAEISPKYATATASGFVGCFAYIGASFSGYPLGIIADIWGWNGFFWALFFCGLASIAILLPLWQVKEKASKSAMV